MKSTSVDVMWAGVVIETCHLSLNYAWLHATCCMIQITVHCLYATRWKKGGGEEREIEDDEDRNKDDDHLNSISTLTMETQQMKTRQNLRVAHAFGLFAFTMDYGLMYLTKGSRTISYPHGTYLDVEDSHEPLSSIGVFVFFLWWGYAGAVGVVLWAFSAETFLRGYTKGKVWFGLGTAELFTLAFVPMQFWIAPALSPFLHIDDRVLLLSRRSSILTYAIAIPVFLLILYFKNKEKRQDIFALLVSGVGCGLIHHLAVFAYGMRNHHNYWRLAATTLTEWPALLCGIRVLRSAGLCDGPFFGREKDKKGFSFQRFNTALVVMLISMIVPHISNVKEEDAVASLIAMIHGETMSYVGTAYLWTRTCAIPMLLPSAALRSVRLDCWETNSTEGAFHDERNEKNMLVIAAAAKSGSVLAARIAAEVGEACSRCAAIGHMVEGFPAPYENSPPPYAGDLLVAATYLKSWPAY